VWCKKQKKNPGKEKAALMVIIKQEFRKLTQTALKRYTAMVSLRFYVGGMRAVKLWWSASFWAVVGVYRDVGLAPTL
jgi:hypothetical protein